MLDAVDFYKTGIKSLRSYSFHRIHRAGRRWQLSIRMSEPRFFERLIQYFRVKPVETGFIPPRN
jgi:hypothetical protein